MMWVYDDKPTDYESEIKNTIKHYLKNDEASLKGAKFLGLYKFLTSRKFKDANELYESVFLDKKTHFFSKQDAESIYEQLGQSGGSGEPLDKLVERWFMFIYYLVPTDFKGTADFISEIAFPLKTIEEDLPGFGPIIGMSLDFAVSANTLIEKNLQKYSGIITGLLPIPEAELVGLIGGYLISTGFIFTNMIIHISRRHLGEAFKQSFALIPIVGMGLTDMAEQADTSLEKLGERRAALLKPLTQSSMPILNTVGKFLLNNVVIDPNYEPSPEELKAKAQEISGTLMQHASNFKESAKGAFDIAKNHVQETMNNPQAAFDTAKNHVQEISGTLMQHASNFKESAIDIAKNPQLALNQNNNQVPVGGKRLSKRRRKKSKWRTLRKLK